MWRIRVRMRALSAAVALCTAFTLAQSAESTRLGAAFRQAPPLVLQDLDGNRTVVDFSQSKLTLVNFWAVWCPPCKDELPQINRLARKYGEKGFRAVGVAVESGQASDVADFLKENFLSLSFPILMGTEEATTAYGDIEIVPTSYLVGSEGEVLATHVGATEDFEESLGAEIEAFLGEADLARSPSARRPEPGSP